MSNMIFGQNNELLYHNEKSPKTQTDILMVLLKLIVASNVLIYHVSFLNHKAYNCLSGRVHLCTYMLVLLRFQHKSNNLLGI